MSYLSANSLASYKGQNLESLDEGTMATVHNLWSRLFIGIRSHALNSKSWTTILGILYAIVVIAINAGLIASMGGIGAGIAAAALGGLGVALNPLVLINIFCTLGGFTDWIDKKFFDSYWTISKKKEADLLNWCKSERNAFFVDSESKESIKGALGALDFSDKLHKKFTGRSNMVGRTNTRLATRRFGSGAVETATTCLCLVDPKRSGFYVVYPTFDEDHIYDIKVLCAENQDKKPKFFVKKLDQWDKVNYDDCKNKS